MTERDRPALLPSKTPSWARSSFCRQRPRWALVASLAVVVVLVLSGGGPMIGGRSPAEATGIASPAPVVASPLAPAFASLERGDGPASGTPLDCRYVGTALAADCAVTSAATLGSWSREGPGPEGASAGSVAMVYDAKDGVAVVLVGGSNNHGPTSTWTYADGRWSLIVSTSGSSSSEPVGCQDMVMAYDPAEAAVLLFEPENCTDARQTWTFSAGSWTELSPSASPPVEYAYAWMGAISPTGPVLLFGPPSSPWTFANGTWSPSTNSSLAGPSGLGSFVYDSADGALLEFVYYASDTYVNETWEFHAGQWSELGNHSVIHVVAPSPRYGALFLDDPADGYVLLVGGYSPTNHWLEQLWTFQGGTWTNRTAAGVPAGLFLPAYAEVGAFEPGLGAVAFLGVPYLAYGTFPNGSFANGSSLWTYRTGSWTNLSVPSPPAASESELAYDASDGYAVLFTSNEETWTFQDGSWAELATSAVPPFGPMSYDASSGYVVLFAQGETWEFVGGQWAEITPARTPPGCVYCSLAYDPEEGYVVYVGWTATGPATWEFSNGSWTNLTPTETQAPDGGPVNPLVYDPVFGGVLMLGTSTYNGTNLTNQTWLFSSGTWTQLPDATDVPGSIQDASVAFDTAIEGVLLFGGESWADGTWKAINATWLLGSSSWASVGTTSAPSAREGAAMAFVPALGGMLLLGGDDGDDWWTWTPLGPGAGPIVESVVAEPNPAEIGAGLTITVTTAGGTAPLSYVYAGLPAGCVTSDEAVLTCTPSAAGSFTVTVNVTDERGNLSTGETGLVVIAAPTVSSFVAEPTTVAVGVRTLLDATVTGGTSPYSYVYTGLPPGCFSQDVPLLPCVPQASGAYAPAVAVTDAAGVMARATVSLTVTTAGSPGSPTITSFAVTPATVGVGNTTTFEVTASEDSSSLSYAFTGLPPGCSSSNVSEFSCLPAVAGAYVVTAWVTDPVGRSTTANLTLDVTPVGGGEDPLVEGFVATPSAFVLGNSTVLEVTVRGPVTAFTFAYTGLPSGCASANTSRLACTPHATGAYTVTALVTGAGGNRTTVVTVVTVASTAHPSPSTGAPSLAYWLVLGLVAGIAAGLAGSWEVARSRAARRRAEGEEWIRRLREEGNEPTDQVSKR